MRSTKLVRNWTKRLKKKKSGKNEHFEDDTKDSAEKFEASALIEMHNTLQIPPRHSSDESEYRMRMYLGNTKIWHYKLSQ